MSINEFDNLIKEKFEQHEFAYDPKKWDMLSHTINPAKTKRKILPLISGIAAAIALLVGAYLFLNHNKSNDVNNSIPNNTITNADNLNREQIPSLKKSDVEEKPINELTPSNILQKKSRSNNSFHQKTKKNYVNNSKQANTNTTTPIINKNSIFKSTPLSSDLTFKNESVIKDDQKTEKQIVKNPNPIPVPSKTITNENYDPIFFDPSANKSINKTFISIAGGVNYGSLNAGYTAGINAKRNISKKMFVEGDVTLINNQQIVTASMNNQQFNSFSTPSGTASRRPALEESVNNIYYLQVNPTVGYQLHKNISVGLGADVQKLLQGNGAEKTVVTTTDGLRLIPDWDAGITGKTEYAISRKLKAGILYREGVNNLLTNGNQYFDRRYLQVQLKLILLGNK